MSDPIANLALSEWRRRLTNARKVISAGTMTREHANAALLPWTAIALWCGAEAPEFDAAIAGIVVLRGPKMTRQQRRDFLAEDLCSRPKAVAALATARDKAIAKDDWLAVATLMRIAEVVGPLPLPSIMTEGRKAA